MPVRSVSDFEANLLHLTRAFFGKGSLEEALSIVEMVRNRPACLSATAVELVRETLSKGCVLYLTKAGGWKTDRFIRQGEPKVGRLWQRSSLEDLTLTFSRHSLDFLIWLTANRPRANERVWHAPAGELTLADQLLLFRVYDVLHGETTIADAFRQSSSFTENFLCRLFHPGAFYGESPVADGWFTKNGVVILEALQQPLEASWLESERAKGHISEWLQLRDKGRLERGVLKAYLDAAETSQRRDLARFLLGVLDRLTATPDIGSEFWLGGLQGSGPTRLAERLDVQRAALAVLEQGERLRNWEQQARRIGYLDDDYAAAQFWLSEWERRRGAASTARAEQIVRSIEPL